MKKEEKSLLKRSTRRNEKNVFNFFAFPISLMMMHNACLHAACYSLIKNVFLSPPRALAPLRVHPQPPTKRMARRMFLFRVGGTCTMPSRGRW